MSKRKNNRLLFVTILSFFIMVLGIGTSHARELYEKGDAIYRSNQAFWPAGHAGILCKWDQSNSNDYVNQSVVESLPSGVELTNFHSFHGASDFWGVRMANLTDSQRRQIVAAAESMLANFHRVYNFYEGYKNPYGMRHPITGQWIDPSFRCDGLVEWCYEQAGVDLITADTFATLSPTRQMSSFRFTVRTSAEVADVELISPSPKNASHPYYRGAVNLKALSGDSNNGSGIARVKFYNGTPPNDGNYIGTDDHDETLSGLYKTTWQTTQDDDGRHNICFKSFDQAGNSRDDLIEIIVDNTPPFPAAKLASSRKISAWSNNTKITTTWTAAKDDTAYVDNPADISGIAGYGVVWNTSATSLPPEQKTIDAVTAMTNEAPLPDGKSHYFHIRSVDKAGNWGKESASIGPFWIDATPPNITITVLWEEKDSKGQYTIGRCFRVDVSDPIVNDARSCLDYVQLNGTQYNCSGSASWSKQIYLQTPQWINVKAKDIAGNIETGDRENADPYFIQAPRWENIHPLSIPFEDYAISPKVSPGIKDTVTVEYALPKLGHVTARIYDTKGALIKFIKDTDEAIGAHSFTWSGANASSQFVPDGNYYYVVEAVNYIEDALFFEKRGLIIVDNTLPKVAIEPFTLNMPKWGRITMPVNITDPNLDEIKVYHKLRSSGTYTTITPQKIELVRGKWNIEFDTTDWPDGLYDVKIDAVDFAGNTASSKTAQVNIQKATKTTVKAYDVTTGTDFQTTPYGAFISYFLSRQANVKIEIYTQGSALVKQIVNETQSFGRHTVTWNGANSAGTQLPSGKYKYKITSADDATFSIIGNITLMRVKAYISSPWQGSLVRAFIPVEGFAAGSDFKSYKLEYGQGKTPITWKTIAQSTTQATGGLLGYWDTGYEFKAYCSPVPYPYEGLIGDYTLRLTVYDKSNNQYETRVNVIVGRVISNESGGQGKSPDGKARLTAEPLTLEGSFEVVSIMPVGNIPGMTLNGKTVVGRIYEIEPPMLAFSKPAALTMSYTAREIALLNRNESKIGIYIWDVLKNRWKYLDTAKDPANKVLTAQIREIPRYHCYAAILCDETAPGAPAIFDPVSPIYRDSGHVFGLTEPQNKVELFDNGISRGIFNADYDYGFFSAYLKDLKAGNNAWTAKSADTAGNVSILSAAKTIMVRLCAPSFISSIALKTPDFLNDYNGASVKAGDTLYIELRGADSNPAAIDIAKVKLAASVSNPAGIIIPLAETAANTGIYRGIAYLGTRTDAAARTIAAVNNEDLIISAIDDPAVKIAVNVEGVDVPDGPSIYSTSHPSICQNTFEDSMGEWAERGGLSNAALARDSAAAKTGVYSLKVVNEYKGGDFSCHALMSQYDAEEYPFISFDYKITPDVKTNFKVKVNGAYKNLIFTDNLETDGSAIKTVGEIGNVVKDGQWHHAEVNLYELLKKDDPGAFQYTIDEIIMGDWDVDYWYSTIPGNSNAEGAVYWIDNFIITKYITDDSLVEIAWSPNQSYATGHSYVLDSAPDTVPDQISEENDAHAEYGSISDGMRYFHIASCDDAGNWSLPNHYLVIKDTVPPAVNSALPLADTQSGAHEISLQLYDNVSGVDIAKASLWVEGVRYDINNPALSYDSGTGALVFKPSKAEPKPIVFANGQRIDVKLTGLCDKAGNSIAAPYSWSWTYSLTEDVIPPDCPAILYPDNSDIGSPQQVVLKWSSTDTSGIAGYSYLLDKTADTIPDDILDGAAEEAKYSNPKEGTYYFHIKAKDNAGNWSGTTHFMLNIAQIRLLVDNFDDGADPNSLNGASGVFDSGKGSYCRKSYTSDQSPAAGGAGYSMALDYSAASANSYSGYYTLLNRADIRRYKSLSFWVKGGQTSEKFKVGLKDSSNNESKINIDLYLKGGSSTRWQKVIIPLVMFKNIKNWQDMDNFSIVFENAIDPSGSIYIDNIEFTSELGRIAVDNFDDDKDPNAFGANYWTLRKGATILAGYAQKIGLENTACYRVYYSGVRYGTYCGLVMYLADINISDMKTLSFYIKGLSGGEKPNIYIYDGQNKGFVDIEKYKPVTKSWQRVDIPLADFANKGISLTKARELSFVFEWETMSGAVYLDNVEFVSY